MTEPFHTCVTSTPAASVNVTTHDVTAGPKFVIVRLAVNPVDHVFRVNRARQAAPEAGEEGAEDGDDEGGDDEGETEGDAG